MRSHCSCGYLCARLSANCRGTVVRHVATAEEGQVQQVIAAEIAQVKELEEDCEGKGEEREGVGRDWGAWGV